MHKEMKKPPDTITFSKEQKAAIIVKIKEYMSDNFDIEIGQLQSDFFLTFVTDHIGVYYYNKAIADALSFMTEKAEDLYLLMKDET